LPVTVVRRRGGEGDRVPDDDVFLPDQNLLNEEADDALPLLDVEGIGRGAQAG
jgi:hypothetical protein